MEELKSDKKPLYKKWWGVVLLLFIWPFYVLWYTWARSKWDVGMKGLVTFGIAIFLVIAFAIMGEEPVSQESVSTAPEPKVTTPPDTKSQAPDNLSTAPLTKLWLAVDDVVKSRDGIDIQFDKTSGNATVTHYSDAFWDEKALVGGAYRSFVGLGQKAFAITEVTSLNYKVQTDFTDSYGKKDKNDAVEIQMSKDSFNKFDWNNLRGQPIHQQIYAEGNLNIHPGILRAVTLNDIRL